MNPAKPIAVRIAGCAMTMRLLFAAVLLSLVGQAAGQECTADGKLCDTHERCNVWKDEGECLKNQEYMQQYCPASCAEEPQDGNSDGEDTSDCKDLHMRCPLWAKAGECAENQVNMFKYCPFSCGKCGNSEIVEEENLCVDEHQNCEFWASKGECVNNPRYMHDKCAKSCGTCKKVDLRELYPVEVVALITATTDFGKQQKVSGDQMQSSLQVIEETIAYMKNDIASLPEHVKGLCQNRHELCAFWSAIGECQANEAFMLTNCAPSCKTCHLIDIEARCPRLDNAIPALRPGDLNKMFERIAVTAPGNRTLSDEERQTLQQNKTPEYTVHVHSRPSIVPAIEISRILDQNLPPWVISFDNFLTPEECQTLIDLGYQAGYERSRDVGARKFDGTHEGRESSGRTSENAWCSTSKGCRANETVQRVMGRMSSVMNIPADNSEDLQLLKYDVGQFYNTHHDYIPHQKDRQCGPRILTFFLYLSDVEAGGGTHFPELDITVMPKVGRALLWPSILDSHPLEEDRRTTHEALPVVTGTKFAANGWFHMFNYVAPQARGCT